MTGVERRTVAASIAEVLNVSTDFLVGYGDDPRRTADFIHELELPGAQNGEREATTAVEDGQPRTASRSWKSTPPPARAPGRSRACRRSHEVHARLAADPEPGRRTGAG